MSMDGVCIGKQKPPATRGLGSDLHGMVLPHPPRRKRRRIHYFHSAERSRDHPRAVCGIVVDNDDLVFNSVLFLKRLQAVLEAGFLITSRYDDGNHWLGIRGEVRTRWVGVHEE